MIDAEIKVLIVDDHPIMLVGIAAIVHAQPGMSVIGQASCAEQAIAMHRSLRPDIMLLDLRLPDRNGVEVIREVIAESPAARIVVLTTYEGDEDIHRALQAGARGYLIKGLPHQTLVQALRRVHAGQKFIPRVVNETLSTRVPKTELSPRERQVLQLIFAGKGNREIAEELMIKEATVKTHVGLILTRLNVEDRTQAVVEALKRGLVHL